MDDTKIPPELPDRDKLMTRPNPTPLPITPDPSVHGQPADPKPKSQADQVNNPKAKDIDYVA